MHVYLSLHRDLALSLMAGQNTIRFPQSRQMGLKIDGYSERCEYSAVRLMASHMPFGGISTNNLCNCSHAGMGFPLLFPIARYIKTNVCDYNQTSNMFYYFSVRQIHLYLLSEKMTCLPSAILRLAIRILSVKVFLKVNVGPTNLQNCCRLRVSQQKSESLLAQAGRQKNSGGGFKLQNLNLSMIWFHCLLV